VFCDACGGSDYVGGDLLGGRILQFTELSKYTVEQRSMKTFRSEATAGNDGGVPVSLTPTADALVQL
jgi:hypothetical protein